MKTIPRAERLIAALDVAGVEEAKALVRRLGDSVSFYKVGLELFMAAGARGRLRWGRFLGAGSASTEARAGRATADRHAGNQTGAESAHRRPEAHGRRGAGVRERR